MYIKNPKKWSVVHFLTTNTVALVPNNWIRETEDGTRCFWPEGDKDVSKKIRKHYTPDDQAWEFLEICVLKEYDKYDEAKEGERRLENEFTDIENEKSLGRGQRKRKAQKDSSFVDDIPPPPKLHCLVQERDLIPDCEVNNSSNQTNENPVQIEYIVQEDGVLIETEPTTNACLLEDDTISTQNASTITMSSLSSSASASQLFGAIMEVRELVKEIKNHLQNQGPTTVTTNLDTVPKEAFKKYHKLMKYEKLLESDKTYQKQLETMLFLLGGSSILDMTKRGLKRLFSNRLATRCSWLGRNHNYPVYNLIIIKVLKAAVRKRYSDLSDFFFEDTVKLWFRQAGLRYTRECAKSQE